MESDQCCLQNLNTEGMQVYFTDNWYLFCYIKNAIIVECLLGFEGMKAVSSPVQRVLKTLLKDSIPFIMVPGEFATVDWSVI